MLVFVVCHSKSINKVLENEKKSLIFQNDLVKYLYSIQMVKFQKPT